nr:hypothetical protein [Tanacetum cinerariifolium]
CFFMSGLVTLSLDLSLEPLEAEVVLDLGEVTSSSIFFLYFIFPFRAYQEYYAVASGVVPLKGKIKYKKNIDELVTSPKSKTTSASKGSKLKSKDKVTKPDMKKQPAKKTKAKGLAVLFKSKVLNEQAQKTFGINEGTGTIPRVPNVPQYESASDKESLGDSEDEGDNDDNGDNDDDAESDDHDDDSDDERTKSDNDEISDPNLTNVYQTEYEEEDVDEGVPTLSGDEFTDEEKLDDEEDDEVLNELYKDVNVNLEKGNSEMTDANQRGSEQQNVSQESGIEQEEEDAHIKGEQMVA